MQAQHESEMSEAAAAHRQAMTDALELAAQESELTARCQLADHTAELDQLRAEHEGHLTEVALQRKQDQAESLSHLTQALEQLSEEHASTQASAELHWTDAQTDQQQLYKQQLLDLSLQHDSSLTDTISHWQERLQLTHTEHSAELTQLSAQHEAMICHVREEAEAAEQLHTVKLINLQLEFQQVEHSLKAQIDALHTKQLESMACHRNLEKQLQVRQMHLWY